MTEISPSVLTADFLTLSDYLKRFEECGVDMVHLDVMDGQFVPNISFGVPVIKSIKEHTSLPLDIHLMIDRPDRYIEDFAKYADYLSFHFEAGSDNEKLLKKIKNLGCKACITIKPKTPAEAVFGLLDYCDMVLVMSVEPGFGGQKFMPQALNKLEVLKNEINKRNLKVELEVDGGINAETAPRAVKAGATVLVAGSYVFNSSDLKKTVNEIKSL